MIMNKDNEYKKMITCSYMLPPPGGEVVRGLITEITRLREGLRLILQCPTSWDGVPYQMLDGYDGNNSSPINVIHHYIKNLLDEDEHE